MRDFCMHMQTLLFTGWAGQNLQDQVSFQSHCSTQQRWSTTHGSRRTNMPKAKKHLMPIENSRPARPTMAKASASKSHCDGLCLLVCAFSKKPCRQGCVCKLTVHAVQAVAEYLQKHASSENACSPMVAMLPCKQKLVKQVHLVCHSTTWCRGNLLCLLYRLIA